MHISSQLLATFILLAFCVCVQDTTPPTTPTCPSSYDVEATSASGATITYTVNDVTDIVSGTITPVVSPASGSLLSLGSHTVTATATDAAGKSSSCSFIVTVKVRERVPGVVALGLVHALRGQPAKPATGGMCLMHRSCVRKP